MTRFLTVGAAQMGPIQRSHSRRDVVERLIAHLREARRMGCDLVVFPELTLTTFFPRWWMKDQRDGFPVFRPKHMTPEQLFEGWQSAWKIFYSGSSILRRAPRALFTSRVTLFGFIPINPRPSSFFPGSNPRPSSKNSMRSV